MIHSEDPTTVEQLKAGGHQEYTVGGQSVYMLPHHHRRAFPDARGTYVHAKKSPTESHERRPANGDFVRQPGRSLDNVVGGGKKAEPSRAHFIRSDEPMGIKAGEKNEDYLDQAIRNAKTPKERQGLVELREHMRGVDKILKPLLKPRALGN